MPRLIIPQLRGVLLHVGIQRRGFKLAFASLCNV
jgi:hypothetical protein